MHHRAITQTMDEFNETPRVPVVRGVTNVRGVTKWKKRALWGVLIISVLTIFALSISNNSEVSSLKDKVSLNGGNTIDGGVRGGNFLFNGTEVKEEVDDSKVIYITTLCARKMAPSTTRYRCDSCDGNDVVGGNPCSTGFECMQYDQASFCVRPSGIEECDPTRGGVGMGFKCIGCNRYNTTVCTSPDFNCNDENNHCDVACSSLQFRPTGTRDFSCPCSQGGVGTCPPGFDCINSKSCSANCELRLNSFSSLTKYEESFSCPSCNAQGCPIDYLCVFGKCFLKCDASTRPRSRSYECPSYVPLLNPCLNETHSFNEVGPLKVCTLQSCRLWKQNGGQCKCSDINKCPEDDVCMDGTVTGLGFDTCATRCNKRPSLDDAPNSWYECPLCTIPTGSTGTTYENVCEMGYNCEPGLGCVPENGPRGQIDSWTDSDICMVDADTKFVHYAFWDKVDDKGCSINQHVNNDGSGCDYNVDADSEEATKAKPAKYACRCSDASGILNPSTGCSPFLQHTAFGRNLLFNFGGGDRADKQYTTRGILNDFIHFKDSVGGDILPYIISYNRDSGTPAWRRGTTKDNTWAQNAATTANNMHIRSRKPGETNWKGWDTAVVGGGKPHKFGLSRKTLLRLVDENTLQRKITIEVNGTTLREAYINSSLVGDSVDVTATREYRRERDNKYAEDGRSGLLANLQTSFTESEAYKAKFEKYENTYSTLYELVTKYVKSKHVVKCSELPGLLNEAGTDTGATKYSVLFLKYLTKKSSKRRYNATATRRDIYKLGNMDAKGYSERQVNSTWETFKTNYKLGPMEEADDAKYRLQDWTDLDIMFYHMNVGLPYDFQVTSENWKNQLCLWNGDVQHPIGVPNVKGSVLKTERSGEGGSLCLDCRISSDIDGACKGSICNYGNGAEGSRGACGDQMDPDRCVCEHPLDARVYKNELGIFKLHWSSWESNMVRDSNGDSSGQCGKPVRCFLNPVTTEVFKKVVDIDELFDGKLKAEVQKQVTFSSFIPYSNFETASADEDSKMFAYCQCANTNWYTGSTSTYNFCESKTRNRRSPVDLRECASHWDPQEPKFRYIPGLGGPRGKHYPDAYNLFCSCAIEDDQGNPTNETHYRDPITDRCVAPKCVNGEADKDTGLCGCNPGENLVIDESIERAADRYFWGDLCQHTTRCYRHKNDGTYPKIAVSMFQPTSGQCKCPKTQPGSHFHIYGTGCMHKLDCGENGIASKIEGNSAGAYGCVCGKWVVKQYKDDGSDYLSDLKTKMVETEAAYLIEVDRVNKKEVGAVAALETAKRRLWPGWDIGSKCDGGWHHCVFGTVTTNEQCGGEGPCCICHPHYTGEHCDTPCGFMCVNVFEKEYNHYEGKFMSSVERITPTLAVCGESTNRIQPKECPTDGTYIVLNGIKEWQPIEDLCISSVPFGTRAQSGIKYKTTIQTGCFTHPAVRYDRWAHMFDCEYTEASSTIDARLANDEIFPKPLPAALPEWTDIYSAQRPNKIHMPEFVKVFLEGTEKWEATEEGKCPVPGLICDWDNNEKVAQPVREVLKYLMELGWQRVNWPDGILEEPKHLLTHRARMLFYSYYQIHMVGLDKPINKEYQAAVTRRRQLEKSQMEIKDLGKSHRASSSLRRSISAIRRSKRVSHEVLRKTRERLLDVVVLEDEPTPRVIKGSENSLHRVPPWLRSDVRNIAGVFIRDKCEPAPVVQTRSPLPYPTPSPTRHPTPEPTGCGYGCGYEEALSFGNGVTLIGR